MVYCNIDYTNQRYLKNNKVDNSIKTHYRYQFGKVFSKEWDEISFLDDQLVISAKVIKSAKLVTLYDMIYLSQLVVVGEVDDELWLWLVPHSRSR